MQEYSSWTALGTGTWAKPDTQIPNLNKHRTETLWFGLLFFFFSVLHYCRRDDQYAKFWYCAVSLLVSAKVWKEKSFCHIMFLLLTWLQKSQHNQGMKMLSGMISRTDGKRRIRGEKKINWFASDERWEALFWSLHFSARKEHIAGERRCRSQRCLQMAQQV